jgi:hypothetical protein
MSKKAKKRTTKKLVLGCPHCKSTEGFSEGCIVSAKADVLSFEKNGDPVYGGESDVDWNSQEVDPNIALPYACNACGEAFEKPVPVESN